MNRTALLGLIAIVLLGAAAFWFFGDFAQQSPTQSAAVPPAQMQAKEQTPPAADTKSQALNSDDGGSPSSAPPDAAAPPPEAMGQGAPPPVPLDGSVQSNGGARDNAEPAPAPPPPPPAPPLRPREATERGRASAPVSAEPPAPSAPPAADAIAPPNTPAPATTASQDIPIFPYPVPKASATQALPRNLLVGSVAHPTFGTVAEKLEHALERAGYGESSYYALAGGHGIAVATQLEQINDDGSPKVGDARFQKNLAPLPTTEFSLTSYLKALFTARSGRFRVIVFTLSGGIRQDSRAPSESVAITWAGAGQTHLPVRFASIPFTDEMTCTALIYEFEKVDYNADAKFIDPGRVNAMAHLVKAGIWSLLGR